MMELRLDSPGTGPLDILCLGAHADDIEIGCGGTILELLARRPVRVRWVVFSATEARRSEAEASALRFLDGASEAEVVVQGFTDGFFPSERAGLKEAVRALAAARDPHLIFTHDEADLHQDHRTLAELTRETFRQHLVLGYEVPKYDGGLRTPNAYVAVDDEVRRRKVDLLMESFPSQREKHWFEPAVFDGLMRLRGLECVASSGYAEGFHVGKARIGL
jgi:LmbE family N-acetylglucosaminyl deacetylase